MTTESDRTRTTGGVAPSDLVLRGMIPNRTLHYCKHCQSHFRIDLADNETGPFILRCPNCGWKHFRVFRDGEAVSCDPPRSADDVIPVIEGRR